MCNTFLRSEMFIFNTSIKNWCRNMFRKWSKIQRSIWLVSGRKNYSSSLHHSFCLHSLSGNTVEFECKERIWLLGLSTASDHETPQDHLWLETLQNQHERSINTRINFNPQEQDKMDQKVRNQQCSHQHLSSNRGIHGVHIPVLLSNNLLDPDHRPELQQNWFWVWLDGSCQLENIFHNLKLRIICMGFCFYKVNRF